MTPPSPALARHRYLYALFNPDSNRAGDVFLPDDRQDPGPEWCAPVGSTRHRVAVFASLKPDGTPVRRWLYDYQGNPLATETWRQDYDRTWKWMNLEWIAEYTYDDRGRLATERYYHSAHVWGETLVHHYDKTDLRFLTERHDYDRTQVRGVEMVRAAAQDQLTGWTIALGRDQAWTVLFDRGPYEVFCEPANPYYPGTPLPQDLPLRRPSSPLWMTRVDSRGFPAEMTCDGETREVYQTQLHHGEYAE